MRAVMFWWWMRYLFISGKVWKVPVPAVVYPILAVELPRWAGMVSYGLKFVILVTYTVVTTLVVGLVVIALINEANNQGYFDLIKNPASATKAATASFFKLLWRYIHDRICPSIQLT